jgi:hypothetical protein
MTAAEFDLIEQALAIRLPDVYRRELCPFGVPDGAGNSDTEVWDDARRLIALNQRLRADVNDWPPWLFATGQAEGDACGYAIDTRGEDCPVWWLDHMRLERGSGPIDVNFTNWFIRWVGDASPKEDGRRHILWFLLVWFASSVAGVIGYWLWAVRVNNRLRRRKR